MADLSRFNISLTEAEQKLLPDGEYLAIITSSDYREARSGAGSYLELVFEIIKGEYTGSRVFLRLCLEHANQTAVQIARSTLARLARELGFPEVPRKSEDLHNREIFIQVVQRAQNDGVIRNEIRSFRRHEIGSIMPPWKRNLPPASPPATPQPVPPVNDELPLETEDDSETSESMDDDQDVPF